MNDGGNKNVGNAEQRDGDNQGNPEAAPYNEEPKNDVPQDDGMKDQAE